jgi:hypothetical protein
MHHAEFLLDCAFVDSKINMLLPIY